jgi:hypothetical protein
MNSTLKLYKMRLSLLAGLLISILTLQVQAETTGQFGRLFTKPSERTNLNVLRQSQQLKVVTPQDKPDPEDGAEAESVALPNPVTLQGYVKRSDGASTLWINKQAVQEDSSVDDVKIGRLNQQGFSKKGTGVEGVDVKIPANGKKIHLKAGQMYEPETNQIIELQVVEKAKRLNLEETGVIDGHALDSNKVGNRAE